MMAQRCNTSLVSTAAGQVRQDPDGWVVTFHWNTKAHRVVFEREEAERLAQSANVTIRPFNFVIKDYTYEQEPQAFTPRCC